MAGHSKWANIQHRKRAQDSRRGKLFTRLIREITVAARQGGGDSESNPRLRTAIDKALQANMTRDTIDKAAKRGAGDIEGRGLEEVRYEGYGPAGVAIMVDCVTDNRNRTAAEVRHAFGKAGGSLGATGSVAYQFAEQGVIVCSADADFDALFEIALEAGADDVTRNDDGSTEIVTTPARFVDVQKAVEASGASVEFAEVTMRPSIRVKLDRDAARSVLDLIDAIEELDDIQSVYSNAEFSEETLAEIA